MGRPKLNIDPEVVKNLAAMDNTVEDIAVYCKCSKDTLERRFAAQIAEGRALGRISLRKTLHDQAKKGNPIAMRLLAMNSLAMADKTENKSETKVLVTKDAEFKVSWQDEETSVGSGNNPEDASADSAPKTYQ